MSLQQVIFVCKTCSSALNNKRIPAVALVNGLFIETIPPIIEQMNWLEMMLIKPVRFMQAQCLLKPTIGGGKHLLKAAKGTVIPVPISATLNKTGEFAKLGKFEY